MSTNGTLKDIVTDVKGSVVATGDAGGLHARGYAPYGYAPPADSASCALGYDGEYTDPITGDYHLGNGYRAYSPTLMRFTAPDSWAPFSSGGLNPYAYCAGNPINASDPSGHMPKWTEETLFWGSVSVLALDAVLEGRDAYLLAKELKRGVSSGGETAEDLDNAWDWKQPTHDAAPSPGARRPLIGPRGKTLAKTAWHGVMFGKDAGAAGAAIAGYVVQKKRDSAAVHNGNGTASSSNLYLVAQDVLWGTALFDAAAGIVRIGMWGRSLWRARTAGGHDGWSLDAPPARVSRASTWESIERGFGDALREGERGPEPSAGPQSAAPHYHSRDFHIPSLRSSTPSRASSTLSIRVSSTITGRTLRSDSGWNSLDSRASSWAKGWDVEQRRRMREAEERWTPL
jgi:RHS repeat-associated protein